MGVRHMLDGLDPFTVRFISGLAILIVTGLVYAWFRWGLEP